ncbi:kinetochore protein NDC80 homolog isoform X3 [Cryptotermes secundus]|nr:kinetochore protein NDC80 homolog isoform X3 [Cryptotermes secundus]XP_033611210.1 kinetochore protein NDC80 homolog isoform X3 [Cryptotermes secundus]XP_033611211.1 kinetochore protein NDC80 homolog isoform X3 [Cryptotermes secundus]
MGKSSLGKRKTSVLPIRLSSLGNMEIPEGGNTQRGRSSVKKSLIPRSSRNRTRSSSPGKDAVKHASSATSLKRSRSNTNLQYLGIGTPMTPMYLFGGIPGTAQSSRSSTFGSGVCGQSSKPVLKDRRPLSDKQFQNAALQKIQSYFHQVPNMELRLSILKALNTRSLTLKLFVEMVSHLLLHFFRKNIINMSNYADEIPHLAKRLGYPGSVKKSWLITANSSHSWPNVIGFLSWLVDLVGSCSYEKLRTIMFAPEDGEDIPENILDAQTMFSYYIKCHDLFNKGASQENMATEDSQLIQEMVKKLSISDKDFECITKEIENMKGQLEDPEEVAAQREMRELETIAASLQNDVKKQQDCVQKKDAYRNELQDNIAKLSSNNDMLKAHTEKVRADILRMLHIVDSQSITVEDKKQIETECRQLEETIQMNQACCDAWSKTMYADDLKIAKVKNELKSRCIAYNTSIMEYSNALSGLDCFKMQMTFLHRDADLFMQKIINQMESFRTDLKTKLNEMEAQLEEQEESATEMNECKFAATEEYKNYMRIVEDLKTEMINMKEKVKQEEQILKCNLKKGQEECARLVTMIPLIQEEEKKWEDGKEKVRLVEAHILDAGERAKTFFVEYDAMYEDVIQKLKDQMSRLIETLEHEPSE